VFQLFFVISSIRFTSSVYPQEKLLVVLRDGRKLIGILRTFDQFGRRILHSFAHLTRFFFFSFSPLYRTANIVLEDCIERIYIDNKYGEKKVGLYVVRGENVVLLGELVRKKKRATTFFFFFSKALENTLLSFFLIFFLFFPFFFFSCAGRTKRLGSSKEIEEN
jgi:small nuclear ribonucleoprotein (snRNP)-like protein